MALDNQHDAQQQGLDIQEDGDISKPVDVDITTGKTTEGEPEKPAAGGAGAEQQQQQQPKAPLPRPQARIQNLTHERDSLTTERDSLMRELAEARRAAAEEKAAREVAERSGMETLVKSAKAETAAAEAALRAAKEAKDEDAEITASKRLARAVAEEADADAWAASNPKPAPQQQQQQPQRQQQQQPQEFQPLAGPVRDFIAENAWFNAGQIGNDGRPIVDRSTGRVVSNPDFDPEMHDMAMMEDRRIQREIRIGALKQDFMGSQEYFERIKNRVLTEFPDAFESAEEEPVQQPSRRAPQMDAPRQPVAPSNRQIPGQQGKQPSIKMRLSGEEVDLVKSLVDNGTLNYSHQHPDADKRGKKMSYQDAYVQYAKNKQTDQANRS